MEPQPTEEELGREVKENNQKIVHCLLELRTQRDEMLFLIQKQKEERKKLEVEMERLTYKLCLINKSMAQRMKAKENYDATIDEIEEKYKKLKDNSGDLMTLVAKDCHQLDSLLNKKTSTEETMASPKDEDAQTEISEPSLEIISQTSNPKPSPEECLCLPNKDGRCIREKVASKMIQAEPPVEPEKPTKLEKNPSQEQSKNSESKDTEKKSIHTVSSGEPELSDENARRSFEKKRSKLSQVAIQYKETSLRRSL